MKYIKLFSDLKAASAEKIGKAAVEMIAANPDARGFVILPEACRCFYQNNESMPVDLSAEIMDCLNALCDDKRYGKEITLSLLCSPAIPMPGVLSQLDGVGGTDAAANAQIETEADIKLAEEPIQMLFQLLTEGFRSLDNPRAKAYRNIKGISELPDMTIAVLLTDAISGKPYIAASVIQSSDTVEHKTIHFDNGDLYEGEWKNGKKHGKGKYTFATGEYYEGDYVNGNYHGNGKYVYADGTIYEGDYQNDKRTGKGKYTYASGNYYEGDFVNGNFHGNGKFVFTNGEIYEGSYKDDKRHGTGIATLPDGSRKEITYSMGEKMSERELTTAAKEDDRADTEIDTSRCRRIKYEDGGEYFGEVSDGEPHGQGEMTYGDGHYYIGCWKNGMHHGLGKYCFGGGEWYWGQFDNDDMTGYGVYFNGTIYRIGRFQDGACVTEKMVKSSMKNPKFNSIGNGVTLYCDVPKTQEGYCLYRSTDQLLYAKNDETWVARYTVSTGKMEIGQVDENSMLHDSHAVTLNMESLVAIGEMKHGVPNGINTVYYANGSVVKGIFENGTPTKILLETDKYGHIIEEND